MNPTPNRSPSEGARATARQFLTFRVGSEAYGVDLLKIHEIRPYSTITPLPGAPHYVKGVMNLRGAVIPVLGLRERIGIPTINYDRHTVIVVLSVQERAVGIIVDAVSDVLALTADEIEPVPDGVGLRDSSFLIGLGKTDGHLVTLLAADALVMDALGEPPAAFCEVPAPRGDDF